MLLTLEDLQEIKRHQVAIEAATAIAADCIQSAREHSEIIEKIVFRDELKVFHLQADKEE